MKPKCPHCQEALAEAPDWMLVCPNCGWSGTITYYNNLMKEKNKDQVNKDETCRAEQPRQGN